MIMNFFNRIRHRFSKSYGVPPSVLELYKSVNGYLPPNPVILEAGAHMGYDTLGLSRIYPSAIIHAFEPIPELFTDLHSKVKGRKNVRTYNIALGERCALVDMFVSSGASTASSSILEPTRHKEIFPEVLFNKIVQVPMKSIDVWANEQDVKSIDLMWLDMQGYEVNTIKGAASLIENVSVIYTELCKDELYRGLKIEDEYISFLKGMEFDLLSMSGDNNVKDGVFINRKKLK